nr:hypothetical protein [Tanacetum cinerariifolium]
MDDLIPNLNGRFNIEVDDPEDHIVDSKLKAKRSMWKPSNLPKPLPPIKRKMPCRPRTKRIRHPTEDENKKKRSAKQVTKLALKRSKMGATIKKVHKISAEETRLDEQKKEEEQQRIRQIWREVKEADMEFDKYADEFKDWNKDYEDMICIASTEMMISLRFHKMRSSNKKTP